MSLTLILDCETDRRRFATENTLVQRVLAGCSRGSGQMIRTQYQILNKHFIFSSNVQEYPQVLPFGS